MKISKPKENKCDPGLGHWPGHLNDKWKSWSFPARFPQWRTLDTLSICENIYLNKIYLCHQETASLASCSGITLATWKYATEALLKVSQVFKNAPCGCPKEQALFIESLITWFNYFSSLFWSWNRTLHLSPWDWYHGCSSLRPGHKMKLLHKSIAFLDLVPHLEHRENYIVLENVDHLAMTTPSSFSAVVRR